MKRGLRIVGRGGEAGRAGEAVKDGVTIEWKYDEVLERLEVECIHVPFWLDSARIEKDLCHEIEVTLDRSRAA